MRSERNVRADTGELTLKKIMWEELSPVEGHYHLYMQNARGEDEETHRISRQWTYMLRTRSKPKKSAVTGSTVNVRLRTTWNLVDRHVNANTAWDETRATTEFKKLAGVQQSLACKLRVEDQAGVRVRFQISAVFTYTVVVAGRGAREGWTSARGSPQTGPGFRRLQGTQPVRRLHALDLPGRF
jgi:hypothetical protein